MKLAIKDEEKSEVTTSLALVEEEGEIKLVGYQGRVRQILADIYPDGSIILNGTFFRVPFALKLK